MAPVFDPFRLASVSLDVLAAGRAGPGALAARQRTRLARMREAAVRASRFYREHLAVTFVSDPIRAARNLLRSKKAKAAG